MTIKNVNWLAHLKKLLKICGLQVELSLKKSQWSSVFSLIRETIRSQFENTFRTGVEKNERYPWRSI